MDTEIDFTEDTQAKATPDTLKLIHQRVEDLKTLLGRIEKGEALLKELKEKQQQLETVDLPDLLDSVGLEGLPLAGGQKLSMKKIIRASIPTTKSTMNATGARKLDLLDRRNAAFQYLHEVGADSVIKNEVVASLGSDSQEEASKAIQLLESMGLTAHNITDVHPQTLTALVSELLEQGQDVPFDTLGVFVGKKAVIK